MTYGEIALKGIRGYNTGMSRNAVIVSISLVFASVSIAFAGTTPSLKLVHHASAKTFLEAKQMAPFALHQGDRVVFYGDSITDNSPYTYDIEAWTTLRYPHLFVHFMNAGVGGDRVSGGWMGPIDQRLPRDLFSRRPTVITIMLGMNDAGYQAFNPALFTTYKTGYQHIIDEIKEHAPNARVWLIQPSPFDDVTRAPGWNPGYNSVIITYGGYVKQLAQQNGYGVIDQNTPLVDMLQKANAANPTLAQKIIPDRIHPTAQGHLVSSDDILKAWHFSPMVSDTTIDWKTGHAKVINGKVSGWNNGTFKLQENSLPIPFDRTDAMTKLVLDSSTVAQDLNHEILRVNDMPTGNYILKIDGKPMGTFSDANFSSGIDLSTLPTPMIAQANQVVAMTGRLTYARYQRWRTYEFGFQDFNNPAKAKMLVEIRGFEKSIRAMRDQISNPLPHQFEIVPAP